MRADRRLLVAGVALALVAAGPAQGPTRARPWDDVGTGSPEDQLRGGPRGVGPALRVGQVQAPLGVQARRGKGAREGEFGTPEEQAARRSMRNRYQLASFLVGPWGLAAIYWAGGPQPVRAPVREVPQWACVMAAVVPGLVLALVFLPWGRGRGPVRRLGALVACWGAAQVFQDVLFVIVGSAWGVFGLSLPVKVALILAWLIGASALAWWSTRRPGRAVENSLCRVPLVALGAGLAYLEFGYVVGVLPG